MQDSVRECGVYGVYTGKYTGMYTGVVYTGRCTCGTGHLCGACYMGLLRKSIKLVETVLLLFYACMNKTRKFSFTRA